MESNRLSQISCFIDENNRQIRFGLSAVAVTGLLYALRSIRPVQKFKHATSLPQSFVDRKLKLNGVVTSIESYPSVVLRVDHIPIIGARYRKQSSPGLAVSICCLNVTNNGMSWLQHMLLQQNIQFLLLKRVNNQVNCIVYYQKKNVAEELLKLGFASVEPIDFDLEKDKVYLKYYKSLLKFEEKAENRRLGLWANAEYTRFEKVYNKILDIFSILYKFRR